MEVTRGFHGAVHRLETSVLKDEIHRLYDDLPPIRDGSGLKPIHPFIGEAFRTGDPRTLRVLSIGFNSYISECDIAELHPDWFPAWIEGLEFHYPPRMFAECAKLAEALVGTASFPELSWKRHASLYATNAAKRYLPAKIGYRAATVPERWFEEGAEVWREEVEALHDYGVLPHLVVVFGARIWPYVWRAFNDEPRPEYVADYHSCKASSPLYHRLNQVIVREGDGERKLLLVRLPHPASANRHWSARAVTTHRDFLELL